jgi:hypothetical protein
LTSRVSKFCIDQVGWHPLPESTFSLHFFLFRLREVGRLPKPKLQPQPRPGVLHGKQGRAVSPRWPLPNHDPANQPSLSRFGQRLSQRAEPVDRAGGVPAAGGGFWVVAGQWAPVHRPRGGGPVWPISPVPYPLLSLHPPFLTPTPHNSSVPSPDFVRSGAK